jgi:hypothetical protein
MSLTDRQLKLIEEGIQLAVAAVLAAVRALGDTGSNEPLDWSKLRITETPEAAREKAEKQKTGDRS